MPSPPRTTPLTRAYGGALAGLVVMSFAPISSAMLTGSISGAGLVVIRILLFCAVPVLGLLWLHRAWSRVPEPCRQAYDGRRIGPDEAVWKLFVPVYGVFWLFTTTVGLCGAVERHLARGRARDAKAPSTLAFVASLVQLVPVAGTLISPFLWGAFMLRMDAAQAEADGRDPDPQPPAPPNVLMMLGIIGGTILFEWVVLVVSYLALWQFLNPARV